MKRTNFINKKISEQSGITLVALVVTIIILLVLAGITIASLTGDNGLIGKSGEAKNATEKSQEKEELEVAVLRFTDKRGNLDATKIVDGLQNDIKNLNEVTNTDGKFPVKVEYKNGHKYQITKEGNIMLYLNAGEKAPSDSNAIYSSGEHTAIVPAGFTVSNVSSESSIQTGLVIRDDENNEFVWIPYTRDDPFVEDNNIWELTARDSTSGKIMDSQEELDYYYGTDQNNNSYFDYSYFTYAQDKLEIEKSINKWKGFYIGRYETTVDENGNVGSKPQCEILTFDKSIEKTNNRPCRWWGLYKLQKDLYNKNNNVFSSTITCKQWDLIMTFTGYGSSRRNTNTYTTTPDLSGSSYKDNNTQYDVSKNIYDLAGNICESVMNLHASRDTHYTKGGHYGNTESASTLNTRLYPYKNADTLGSRIVIHIK